MSEFSSSNSMVDSISILGCGWLGERIGASFLKKGWKVNASSRNKQRLEELNQLGFRGYQIDIEDLNKVAIDFFDATILIIATTNKNIIAHQNLVKLLKKSSLKMVLFVSSTSVYEKSNERITVDSPLTTSPLVEIEKEYIPFNKSIILRCGGLIGDNRKAGKFFKKGATIKHPNAPINIIHFDEIIESIQSILNSEEKCKIYNLIQESLLTRYDYYNKAYKALHRESGLFLKG